MTSGMKFLPAAIAAVATAGASSLFMGVSPAQAAPIDGCGTATLIAPGVCELTYTAGTAAFTPTAEMTQLEVLLVGAGGASANQSVPNTNGYAAAGGGSEVKIVDFTGATSDIDLVVGTSGTPSSADDGTTTEIAANGLNAADLGQNGGASGNGNAGASGGFGSPSYGSGGGAGAVPANNADGGDGVVVDDIAPEGSLFSGNLDCYGGGGAIGAVDVEGVATCGGGYPADASGTVAVAPTPNSGGGAAGLTVPGVQSRTGADGVVVVRWSGATVTLNFSANGFGVAPASQTVVAGAAPTRPSDPTASGVMFTGWFTDAAATIPADFSVELTSSTTFYAGWAPALAATGPADDAVLLPVGLFAFVAGVGLVVYAYRGRRRA